MSTSARTLATAALLSLGLAAAPAVTPAAAPPATAPAADPTADQIAAIETYWNDGGWARDSAAVASSASRFLAAQVRAATRGIRRPAAARRATGRLVAVFDIDDTVLSSYACMKGAGFTNLQRSVCVAAGPHSAIKPVVALVRQAQRAGVRVAFVTGRPDGLKQLTSDQLASAGVRGPWTLRLRPSSDHADSVVPFKASARKALQRGGRRVVLSIGDQQSDLSGGAATRTFKLPNPMYTLP
ncbi:HAD family acid phosphatase [Conexibacter sp. JD483]|uniref:HAD family acid phosphatase n=1 Tax=unclassified Conexibacter TaxID=2627773 RepID=UPI002728F34C|nr:MULTISPECIES: HAD family acid phosphatase [unclassified Conexibacter]MDO8185734.1 HAD family acid phosphatase [Conexibacter sp. CPCC 205706]MDO8199111.1 HAD family acid phosphatase [Conexibacter sp. CPCC 205762]MDR9370965.1 HAD family acid phosphatase [Conexibacter sp. JD483]